MKRFLHSGIVVAAGILGIASISTHASEEAAKKDPTKKVVRKFDLRETILRRFFKDNRCPVEPYAAVFVAEADVFGLDWRLLPSLSFVESGGGRYARGNNLFGWANGSSRFASISEAVHHVASTLALGKAYRGKDLNGKLFTYNHRVDYRSAVTDVMKRIYPTTLVSIGE